MTITPASLLTIPAFAAYRQQHHSHLIAYRQVRSMRLGPHAALHFEDEFTVRYQIQEMLRVERISDEAGMREQIDLYAQLLPSGTNWKATLMLQIPDPDLRRVLLPRVTRIAHHMYVDIQGHAPIYAIANEDLDPLDDRPSAVHFLRFELPVSARRLVHAAREVSVGCDHPDYPAGAVMAPALRTQLAADIVMRASG
jgi:hypothetical protein